MRRHLVNTALVVSLLLCAASVAVWMSSYAGVGQLYVVSGADRYILNVGGGQLAFQATSDELFRQVAQGTRWRRWAVRAQVDQQRLWNRSIIAQNAGALERIGLWCGSIPNAGPGGSSTASSTWVLITPIWLVSAVFVIPPAFWLVVIRHRRRSRDRLARGLCPTCGYDSRATPGRCPECGSGQATAVRPAV